MKNKLWFFFVFFILLMLNSCTENPFFKEDKISTKKVTGYVQLSDQSSPASIFVWFETLDLSARTDENGYFEMSFPSAAKQPGGGLNGFYKLYFYMANYQIEACEIFLRQGVPEYATATLDANGRLIKKVILQKIVEITGEIKYEYSSPDSFVFQFTLKAVKDSVKAYGLFSKPKFKGDPTYMAGFIKKAGADNNSALLLYNTKRDYASAEFWIDKSDLHLVPMVIYMNQVTQAPDEYEVFPFLLIKQPDLPAGLWSALGGNVEVYGKDHLNIPMIISGNRVTFKAPPIIEP